MKGASVVVPNRAVICSNLYPPRFIGGAELIAHQQARTLSSLGWKVVVFAGDSPGNAARHSRRCDTYEGLPVYRVGLDQTDFAPDFVNFFDPTIERHFNEVLDIHEADVVHFHNLVGLSVGLVRAARRRGIRTVLTLHDHWGFCHKNTLMKRGTDICTDHTRCAECLPVIDDGAGRHIPIRMRRDFVRMQLDYVDTIIAPSQYLADAYVQAGFSRDRIKVIWYGIDVERFAEMAKEPNEKLRFSFIGHLAAHKGVRTILHALSLLPERESTLVNLVGDGPEHRWCQRWVQAQGLESSVRFWGHVDNARIGDVYRETDVLILPSVWPENQPVCLTEGMASRTTVIASRIGGIPELVEHGRTGYLFEAGNAEDLAGWMSELVRHRSRVSEFGDNGFRRIAENTLANQMQKVVRVYRDPSPRGGGADPAEHRLFVCAGKRVDLECAWAINALSRQGDRRWRFVMADWLDDDQAKDATALWVVDRTAGIESVVPGLRNRLPLLVPEENAELRELCVHARCGLYYRDALEAIRCLAYLAADESARKAMAQNSVDFLPRPWQPDRMRVVS